jgi:ubiquinone/menaquinone biosynthesis C-methylase UbiE
MTSIVPKFKLTPEIEKEHVHNIYNSISEHWSETRYKPWPNVVKFIKNYDTKSLIGDIGCGNGKYIPSNKGNVIAVDFSIPLLETIKSNINITKHNSSYDLCSGDITNLPIRDNTFDAVICIAVLHHLSSEERRLKALRELHRILIPGGKVLIYAWAETQDKTSRHQFPGQDIFVPWTFKRKGQPEKVFQRYCHTYREEELSYLISKIDGLNFISECYDSGNWCVTATKSIKI